MTLPDLNALALDELLDALAPPARRAALLRVARDEDLADGIDVTTESVRALHDQRTVATVTARRCGVVAGLALIDEVIRAFDAPLTVTLHAADGASIDAGADVATLSGPAAAVLTVERTLLNLVGHLSGIATLTRAYVDAARGTNAVICETRKTLPGLRGLEKYAVRCGGGTLHRVGLHDAALYKDNHLAHLDAAAWTDALADAIRRARANVALRFVEVEVDTLAQLDALLGLDAGLVDLVLLDNMTPAQLRDAVAQRDTRQPSIGLEASGGITLDAIPAIAATGVDRISVGALTHSAGSFDFGLDIASPT